MKLFYTLFCRVQLTAALVITLNTSVKAQPTATGDIVFTGYQSSGFSATTDQFAFVSLVSMPVGTVIKFTDNAWNSGSLTFNTNEANITFTVTGAAIPAGREIRIIYGPPAEALFTNLAIAGTVIVTGTSISLPTPGDQIFAYLGPDLAPTVFLSGIHMNVETAGGCGATTAADWDPVACLGNNNTSMKPAALTTGTDAFWHTVEHHNGRFNPINCGLDLSTPAAVRAAVNNPANWFFEDPGGAEASWSPTGPFAYCAFLGLSPLPVTLLSFTGKLNSDKTVTLQWKVAAQQDIQEYIVEESSDTSVFRQLGSVAAGNSNTDSYSYIDMQVAAGNNYYRIKIADLSGKISYSDVVLVNLKTGIKVNVYPNPVTDKLTIQQFGTIQNKTAVLSDGRGNILQQIKLTSLQQTVNMETYPAGVYILKLEDGTVFKVVKQ